jgi:hypothetical protein
MDNIKHIIDRIPNETRVHILYIFGCIFFFIGYYIYITTSKNITITGKVLSIEGSCETKCSYKVEYKLDGDVSTISLHTENNPIKVGDNIKLSYNSSIQSVPVMYKGENSYIIPVILYILSFGCFYSGYYIDQVIINKNYESFVTVNGLQIIANKIKNYFTKKDDRNLSNYSQIGSV